MTRELLEGLLLAAVAAGAIPLGALLARVESLYPRWQSDELHHGIVAFGGGALLSAVALVLVPDGVARLAPVWAVVVFAVGGVTFALVDWLVARSGGGGAQLLAMLLDFVPECIALGALLAGGAEGAVLLALLIALQNLPESFNAFREIRDSRDVRPGVILLLMFGLALLGPLAAWVGMVLLSDADVALGATMLFAAGGILYIVFQDIAPMVRLEMTAIPPLGAVLGFALGLAGYAILHG